MWPAALGLTALSLELSGPLCPLSLLDGPVPLHMHLLETSFLPGCRPTPGGGEEPALWCLVPESGCAGWRPGLARQHVMWGQSLTWEAVGEPAGGGEPLKATLAAKSWGSLQSRGLANRSPRGSAGSGRGGPQAETWVSTWVAEAPVTRPRGHCGLDGGPGALNPGLAPSTVWPSSRPTGSGGFGEAADPPCPPPSPPTPTAAARSCLSPGPQRWSPSHGLGRPVHPIPRRPLLSTFPDLYVWKLPEQGPVPPRLPGRSDPCELPGSWAGREGGRSRARRGPLSVPLSLCDPARPAVCLGQALGTRHKGFLFNKDKGPAL